MYSYAEVFYKTDDTPGWKVAILSGDEECVKQKASKLWKNYKIFSGNTCAYEVYDVYPAMPEPEMVQKFLSTIKTKKYAYLIFEEYDFIKILAWNNDGKSRIKVQSYNSHDEVKELLDFECTTNCFISAFEDFLKSITVQYKEINDIVRKEANKEAYGR